MPDSLKVLILEDHPDNAEKLIRALGQIGFQAEGVRVASEAEYLTNLNPEVSLVLASDSTADLKASRAVKLMRDRGLDIPFILVCDCLDANDLPHDLKNEGVSNFLLKDHLEALGPAVNQALGDKAFREEMRLAAEALRNSEEYARNIIASSLDMIVTTDVYRRIVEFNKAAQKTFGYTRDEVVGKRVKILYANTEEFKKLGEAMRERGQYVGEVSNKRKNGELFVSLLSATVLRDSNGASLGVVGVSRDISERKMVEEELRYLSMHDTLTGLYNRGYFEGEMARLERSRQFPVSIIMADIDGLKNANDRMGHAYGDELLRFAANIMRAAFRAEDVVARFGGDELAVLLPDTSAILAEQALDRIRGSLASSGDGHPKYPLSMSLGVATADRRVALAEILKRADERMYEDKNKRRILPSNGGEQ